MNSQLGFIGPGDDLSATGTVTGTSPVIAPESQVNQQTAVMLSSETNEWYTPGWVMAHVTNCLGAIDLDPASCEEAAGTVKAKSIYTVEDDGLALPWRGKVFCNPPYGKTQNKSNQEIWAMKAIEEYNAQRMLEGILLLKTAFGYDWLTNVMKESARATHGPGAKTPYMAITEGLIAFDAPKARAKKSGKAKHATLFLYLGRDPERFADVFNEFCFVFGM